MWNAREIGTQVGRAIARDVVADKDMARRWTGLDPQDADRLFAAGMEPETDMWEEAVEAARQAFLEEMAKLPPRCKHCGLERPIGTSNPEAFHMCLGK